MGISIEEIEKFIFKDLEFKLEENISFNKIWHLIGTPYHTSRITETQEDIFREMVDKYPDVEYKSFKISSNNELLSKLKHLEGVCNHSVHPIIHFDAHGDKV